MVRSICRKQIIQGEEGAEELFKWVRDCGDKVGPPVKRFDLSTGRQLSDIKNTTGVLLDSGSHVFAGIVNREIILREHRTQASPTK